MSFFKAYDKAIQVIASCNTGEHLVVARNYINLVANMSSSIDTLIFFRNLNNLILEKEKELEVSMINSKMERV